MPVSTDTAYSSPNHLRDGTYGLRTPPTPNLGPQQLRATRANRAYHSCRAEQSASRFLHLAMHAARVRTIF
jgi:hypothetical protein